MKKSNFVAGVGVNQSVKKSNLLSLKCLRSSLKRNRLGELLVSSGLISPAQLKYALQLQKNSKDSLGRIFLESSIINRRQLAYALTRQFVLRACATLMLSAMTLATFSSKKANAETLTDVPAKISISFNTNASQYGDVTSYPTVFGSSEKRSTNLKPFTKWTSMFKKFDSDLKTPAGKRLVEEWRSTLSQYEGLPLKSLAEKVNNFMNEKRYINDDRNWGQSDYWETPIEFSQRGGDCEDFAISKYAALRAMGVPEERLRIVIVHDNLKNIPHAILIVNTDQGLYALDNQIKTLVSAEDAGRYRPIFSINRTAWWLHTAPGSTQIASAR